MRFNRCYPLPNPVPGLGLGPLVGHVLNPFRIGWYYTSGFVVAEALRDELATLAPQINAVGARLEGAHGDRYYELEIRSHARVLTASEGETCSTCGSYGLVYPHDVLRIADIPDLPLFRLANFPGIVVVREDLQPFFKRELGLSVTFRRAELVS